ncbi:hypothetical protein DMUE_1602 [Dictyocoela muelleri]|nr:hypothetical protein DMUE_1602 [Dictyocoela muelleri]
MQFIFFHKQNSDFKILIKMIMCFAYIPINDLQNTKNDLENFFKENVYCYEIEPVWSWFKSLYIDTTSEIENSIFNPHFWPTYVRTVECEPLTTNACESWHRSLNQYIRSTHPSLKK